MATEIERLPSEHVIPTPRPAGRWWVVPLLALGVFLLLMVLALVVAALRMRQGHYAALEKVKREVARLEAAGEPVTTESLYAFHTLPAGTRDITPNWLDVLRTYDERQFSADAAIVPIVGSGDKDKLLPTAEDSQFAAAEAFLQKYDATLQAVLAAAREEGECCFPMQFEKGIAMLLQHVQKLRNLSQLLALHVRTQAIAGDIDGSLRSLDAMYATSATLKKELCLVEHLVHVALLSNALTQTEWLMNQSPLTDAQLALLQQRVETMELKSGLTTGVIGERAIMHHTFHHLSGLAEHDGKRGAGQLPLTLGAPDGQLGRPADCLKSLELMGEAVAASREPFPEARRKVQLVENQLKSLAGSRNPLDKLQYMVTLLMMPATNAGFDATARGLAQQDCLLAAIAAQRFRLKNGSLPAKLSDLVPDFLPAVPLDPFDGQPLMMVERDGKLAIYSVGKDGIDNGGIDTDPRRPSDSDIVVHVK